MSSFLQSAGLAVVQAIDDGSGWHMAKVAMVLLALLALLVVIMLSVRGREQ